MNENRTYDIAILGGGVLGVSIYHWLTGNPNLRVVLFEKENEIASHTSSRNTGVIHRPFYMDPQKRKFQISTSRVSYALWSNLAQQSGAPWRRCGTIEVANDGSSEKTLEKYAKWALENGLDQQDFKLLSSQEVSLIEPEVRCSGAIYSMTDVSTDFNALTQNLLLRSGNKHSTVMRGARVLSVKENKDGCSITLEGKRNFAIKARTFINAGGGSALDIAHKMSYAKEFSQLFFRGEYWKVRSKFGERISRNIYSVPKHQGYPFLDPHFIVRASGQREIGPNAVLVAGPEVYSGINGRSGGILSMLLSDPIEPKLRLIFNREFLHLVSGEWKSSIYRSEMARRLQRFIPNLNSLWLNDKGVAGVRASMIGRTGFISDAVLVFGESSLHILNYNSPGATGAPAFAAFIINQLEQRGEIPPTGDFVRRESPGWNYREVIGNLDN